MVVTRVKYNGCGYHRVAILHMIGQSQFIFNERPKISEIAAWMNVSKPTARKYLKRLVDNGEIIISKLPYKNVEICRIQLTDDAYSEYLKGMYKPAYTRYAQRVMGIILT